MEFHDQQVKQELQRNKRPMGHNPHLRNQFKFTNTFESYDYVITLIRGSDYPLFEN